MAAKHGVTGLAKTLANELAEYRIRVNTVHPFGVAVRLDAPDAAADVLDFRLVQVRKLPGEREREIETP